MAFTSQQAQEMQDRLDRSARNSRLRRAPATTMAAIEHPPVVQTPEPATASPAGDLAFVPKPSTDEAKLNKTERAYLAHLRAIYPAEIGIQNVTLKLADDCRLTADFNYINALGRWVFVDVKGFQREDALIKMKVAARCFPQIDFVIVKKNGKGWEIMPVKT